MSQPMSASDNRHLSHMSSILRQLRTIAESVMYAAEADTLGEVLQRIADISRETVGARYAALGVPDGRGSLEFFEISGMTPEDAARIPHPPLGRGLLGAIMIEREPIRLENLQQDPRSIGFPENHPHMTRFLGVPILVGQHLFGMFYLTDRVDGQPFDEVDQWLIETTAGYAALAIAGARLRQQQRQLALLEERQRISMDLHDGVIQSIYAIGMYLDMLRNGGTIHPDDLDVPINHLNEVIEDIRRYIMNLSRRTSANQTVERCLMGVVERLHIPPDVQVTVDAPAAPMPFNDTLQEAICQMAQEALSNIIRHADARSIHLMAQITDKRFTLSIHDDGRGFEPETAEHGEGLGLRNIRQRAALHKGELTITSKPGQGSTVILQLPVTSIM
jgi:signal transduction histidine kinase